MAIRLRDRQGARPAAEGEDLRPLMAQLKALWKLRPPGGPEPPAARLVRRHREKRLLRRLERDWPGGFALHRTGDLVYVPAPLYARGRQSLLHSPRAHPAALAHLRAGSVAIDVGASLGEWTVPLARAVGPSGRVVAIEPIPSNCAALTKTLAANALNQVEALCCALGERDLEDVAFAVPIVGSAGDDTGTAHLGPAGGGEQAIRVALRRLDGLVAERRLDRIDLIKIDVEGYERRVLEGAAASIERFRPALVLETGHEGEGDRRAIHDRLARLGYRPIGILLDFGMADADWPGYLAARPPFRAGDAHNLLLAVP